jgi:hypothetical protein
MKFFASVALLAGLAAASQDYDDCYEEPTSSSAAPQKFGLVAIRSGSPVQNTGVVATSGYFAVGGNQVNATCSGGSSNFATFYLSNNGSAYLYTPPSAPVQQLWVDRSGMGQGVTGYTTGSQLPSRSAERTGFSVSNGYFVFDGKSPVACPNAANGGYSIWFTSASNPGGNSGCEGVGLKVVDTQQPVQCEYSQSP